MNRFIVPILSALLVSANINLTTPAEIKDANTGAGGVLSHATPEAEENDDNGFFFPIDDGDLPTMAPTSNQWTGKGSDSDNVGASPGFVPTVSPTFALGNSGTESGGDHQLPTTAPTSAVDADDADGGDDGAFPALPSEPTVAPTSVDATGADGGDDGSNPALPSEPSVAPTATASDSNGIDAEPTPVLVARPTAAPTSGGIHFLPVFPEPTLAPVTPPSAHPTESPHVIIPTASPSTISPTIAPVPVPTLVPTRMPIFIPPAALTAVPTLKEGNNNDGDTGGIPVDSPTASAPTATPTESSPETNSNPSEEYNDSNSNEEYEDDDQEEDEEEEDPVWEWTDDFWSNFNPDDDYFWLEYPPGFDPNEEQSGDDDMTSLALLLLYVGIIFLCLYCIGGFLQRLYRNCSLFGTGYAPVNSSAMDFSTRGYGGGGDVEMTGFGNSSGSSSSQNQRMEIYSPYR